MAPLASTPPSMNQPKEKSFVAILLGPPGAGKGSQAALIKEQMKKKNISLGHIATGDLLREHIKQNSSLGQKAKSFMDKGQLVPDDLILDILFERVKAPDCAQGYILDGFPRTIAQAEAFQKRLGPSTKIVVIHLRIPDEAILERLTKRVICEKCQTPYHLVFSPSKKAGVCDACGGKLIQRSDDTEAVVKKRLIVYHEQTEPLVRYYSELHLLHEVDATAPKERVLQTLLPILGRR